MLYTLYLVNFSSLPIPATENLENAGGSEGKFLFTYDLPPDPKKMLGHSVTKPQVSSCYYYFYQYCVKKFVLVDISVLKNNSTF